MKYSFYSLIIFSIVTSCDMKPNYQSGENIAVCNSINQQQAALLTFSKDKNFDNFHPAPITSPIAIKGQMITFATAGKEGNGYLVKANSEKYLLMIHEWWGLNEQIKLEAERYSNELKVNVLAIDMYDGKVAREASMARKYTRELSDERATEILTGAINYTGNEHGIATIGWCFGGAMSLQAALIAEGKANACVMFYGMPVMQKEQLKPLKAPLLGIFAAKDGYITPQVVDDFERLLTELDKQYTIKTYDANHAFANPTSSRYNQQAADDAFQLTINFLQNNL